jgi:hypothetical protein
MAKLVEKLYYRVLRGIKNIGSFSRTMLVLNTFGSKTHFFAFLITQQLSFPGGWIFPQWEKVKKVSLTQPLQ